MTFTTIAVVNLSFILFTLVQLVIALAVALVFLVEAYEVAKNDSLWKTVLFLPALGLGIYWSLRWFWIVLNNNLI